MLCYLFPVKRYFALVRAIWETHEPSRCKKAKKGTKSLSAVRAKTVERYRNHLIFVKAEQDPTTALWKATTHIQFNEDPVTFRDVWLPRPAIGLRTKRSAGKLMMKEARKWVDERMRDTSQGAVKAPALDSNF